MIYNIKYYTATIYFGFKSKAMYLASAWLGSISSIIMFLVQIMIWKSLLGNGARFNTSFEEMLTYTSITEVTTIIVASFSGDKISGLIRTGDIAIYLVRPLNLKMHLFLDDLGKNLFSVILFNIPACILLGMTWGFVLPANLWRLPLTFIMLLNGMFILFHYHYILGLISFWIINNPFTSWGFQNAESLFSGRVLPIWLCPLWLANLTAILPFRYFTYEPIAYFLEKSEFNDAIRILLIQFFWMALFYLLERIVSMWAMRKLVVQGG